MISICSQKKKFAIVFGTSPQTSPEVGTALSKEIRFTDGNRFRRGRLVGLERELGAGSKEPGEQGGEFSKVGNRSRSKELLRKPNALVTGGQQFVGVYFVSSRSSVVPPFVSPKRRRRPPGKK